MNAKASAKQEERLWKEAVHTLSELHRETDFLSDVQIIPQLIILCYKNSNNLITIIISFLYYKSQLSIRYAGEVQELPEPD